MAGSPQKISQPADSRRHQDAPAETSDPPSHGRRPTAVAAIAGSPPLPDDGAYASRRVNTWLDWLGRSGSSRHRRHSLSSRAPSSRTRNSASLQPLTDSGLLRPRRYAAQLVDSARMGRNCLRYRRLVHDCRWHGMHCVCGLAARPPSREPLVTYRSRSIRREHGDRIPQWTSPWGRTPRLWMRDPRGSGVEWWASRRTRCSRRSFGVRLCGRRPRRGAILLRRRESWV